MLNRRRLIVATSAISVPFLGQASGWRQRALAQTEATTAQTETVDANADTSGTDSEISAEDFEYIPPIEGAPDVRVSGGTRGASDADFVIEAAAPQHVGLTRTASPTLYWYQSEAVTEPVELVVIADDAEAPLVQAKLSNGAMAGFNRVALADYGATLRTGVDYQWSVGILVDPNQPSLDPVSLAGVRLAALDATVAAEIDAATALKRALLYARHGLFYDSMHALSALIQENPGDVSLRAMRAALLRSVALYEPAEFDLKV